VGLAFIGSTMPCLPSEGVCGGSFGNGGTLIDMSPFQKADVPDGVESSMFCGARLDGKISQHANITPGLVASHVLHSLCIAHQHRGKPLYDVTHG
jgi:hypothetical protein